MKGAFLNHLPNILPPERHEEQLGVAAPSKNDVLVGKGCVCNGHHGNKSYRALVDSRKVRGLLVLGVQAFPCVHIAFHCLSPLSLSLSLSLSRTHTHTYLA